jgi:cyclopropane fatty-acyl-phospholipid synthase-like methyltransferase
MEQPLKYHWEKVYQTKEPHQLSWTQDKPETSLEFIRSFHLPKNASIIDIGGGDSHLAECLLEEGYTDITVLDISAASLEKAKKRMGSKAEKISWIVSDIKDFVPGRKYDVWHDRATFHFLTTEEEIKSYLSIVRNNVKSYLLVATASLTGPEKCSGLPIKQYSDEQLARLFLEGFQKIRCINVDHITPFQTKQNFTFCSFRSLAA